MKKLQVVFALFMLLSVGLPSDAKPIPEGAIQRKVIAADSAARSIDAHNKAAFDVQMKVRTHFKDPTQEDDTTKKDCAATAAHIVVSALNAQAQRNVALACFLRM